MLSMLWGSTMFFSSRTFVFFFPKGHRFDNWNCDKATAFRVQISCRLGSRETGKKKHHLCRDGTLSPWLFLMHHRLNFLFRPPTCTSFLPRQSRSASWHLYTPELFLSKTSPIFTWQLKIVQAENPWRKIYQLVKTWSNVGNRRFPPHSSILLVKV